jgi:serine protease Do
MKLPRLMSAVGLVLALQVGMANATDRMNVRVLNAFREVVNKPSHSTARVLGDGRKVALGTIVTAEGHVLTKSSELKGKLEVQVHSGKRLPATIVGVDRTLDLALLKIETADLQAVDWNDGEVPAVGSWLASPGLERDPVSIGVVSVLPRKIPAPSGALGILLDNNEEVVRIVSMKQGSAAEKAGLAVHDIIKSVNGKEVKTRRELIETVRQYQPGEKIELLVRRGEDEFTAAAVLDSLNEVLHGENQEKQNVLGGPLSDRRGGFSSALQHDSVLHPSDCGGPIVGLDGKAVGINIARAGRVESYALPASVVKMVLPELMSGRLAPPGTTLVGGAKSTATLPVSAPMTTEGNEQKTPN